MIKKIIELLKSCYLFWKDFIFCREKKEFWKNNSGTAKTQIIILLSTCLVAFVFYNTLKPAVKGACRVILRSDDNMMSGLGGRIIGIEAKKVVTGTTLREVKSIGTLKANAEVVIKSEINGKIEEILFTEGSEVTKGQELIKFEDDLYKSEKERYEAEYTLRKGEFERNKKLYEQKVGSQKTYDESLAQMNAAKAQLDSATFQLSRTVIKAPFDGTIGILKGAVSHGNIVQQQTDLVNIVDNSQVRVEFMVPAKYIEDISTGQNVDITVDAFKDRVFSGTVDAIDSEVDQRSHSILVRAVIPNKNGSLKHGMFANVKLITGEKSDVVLVDEEALDREGAIEFVWIVDDKGRAYRKRVLTGAKDASGVEILAGLKAGEIVVSTGQLKLTDGSKVKILNTKDFEDDKKDNSEKDDEDKSEDKKKNDESGEVKSLVEQDPEKDSEENNSEKSDDNDKKSGDEVKDADSDKKDSSKKDEEKSKSKDDLKDEKSDSKDGGKE